MRFINAVTITPNPVEAGTTFKITVFVQNLETWGEWAARTWAEAANYTWSQMGGI